MYDTKSRTNRKPTRRLPITVSGNLREDTYAAWEAIHNANEPPTLFRHGGMPARIEHDDEDRPGFRVVERHKMRHYLARVAEWKQTVKRRKDTVQQDIVPPMSIVMDVLATPDMVLPIVTRVVESPIFAANGVLQENPGYQAESKTYYVPDMGVKIPEVYKEPNDADVCDAVSLIVEELLVDFPFCNDSERATAIALLLLPFARELIDGPTPLHLFEKPSPGTGATLLVDMLTYPSTGNPLSIMTEGSDEEEWRKRITAKLMTGPQFLLIDNLRRRLDSAAVSAAITSPTWEDRILGGSMMATLPVRCGWIATGNNPGVSPEISRRTVRCRMDAKQDRPWLREEFKHPDLRTWAKENRGRLIWAALTIIQRWVADGKPMGNQTLGMFENWAAVMGGILSNASITGFLENLTEFYDDSDAEGQQWRSLLAEWWKRFGSKDVTSADLFSIAASCDMAISGNSDRAQKTRFGKMLGQQRDRSYQVTIDEDNTVSVRVTAGEKYRRAQQWFLEPTDNPTASPDKVPF